MRELRRIVIHCSATPEGRDTTVHDIRLWHTRDNGWGDIGYHAVIHLDGSTHDGRPLSTPGAHVRGHNANSLGLCYIGGLDSVTWEPKDTRTPAQIEAMDRLLHSWLERFGDLEVVGHRDLDDWKACPSYDVQADLEARDFWKLRPTKIDPHDPQYLPRVDRSTLAGRAWRGFRRALGLAT